MFLSESETNFDAENKFKIDFLFISGFSEYDVDKNCSAKTIINFFELQNV